MQQKVHDKERFGGEREAWRARNSANETSVEKQDKDGKDQRRNEESKRRDSGSFNEKETVETVVVIDGGCGR